MIRFGKPFGPLLQIKADQIGRVDEARAEQARLTALYRQQPARTHCKICHTALPAASFELHGVGYAWCGDCGHLNGVHDDTAAFAEAVYGEAGAEAYAVAYAPVDADAYWSRVDRIYVPKAEFLRDALAESGVGLGSLSCADFGAGSGYFVAALEKMRAASVVGYEPSPVQARIAETMLGPGRVIRTALDALGDIAAEIGADMVSMIGVLEHLRDPRAILSGLRANPRIRWIYLSLPLAGPSVAVEALFPTVPRRHLVGGHTHLFTESSIDRICADFGLRRVSEWWFGSDLLDLYRAGLQRLAQEPATAGLGSLWQQHLLPALDEMQLALDRKKLSTEVHLLLEKSA
jgi:hypothetical protein